VGSFGENRENREGGKGFFKMTKGFVVRRRNMRR